MAGESETGSANGEGERETMAADSIEGKTVEDWIRIGFELAEENAEIYEDNGWHRCAPYNDWKNARKKLEEYIEKLKTESKKL